MIEFTLSILSNIGLILFFIASLLMGVSTLSYILRTEDYQVLFYFMNKEKWKELNLKEKSYYKNAIGLGALSAVLYILDLAASFTRT